jgi:hypothetical protein
MGLLPLREGNRKEVVPPAGRGNLKEGVANRGLPTWGDAE